MSSPCSLWVRETCLSCCSRPSQIRLAQAAQIIGIIAFLSIFLILGNCFGGSPEVRYWSVVTLTFSSAALLLFSELIKGNSRGDECRFTPRA